MLDASSVNTPLDQIFGISSSSTSTNSSSVATSFGSAIDSTLSTAATVSNGFFNSSYSPTSMVSERAYTVLPRSASVGFVDNASTYTGYTSDRGAIASLRLNTSSSDAIAKADRNLGNIDVSLEVNDLLNNTNGYQKFFLTDVNVSYNEKVQISTTFGDGEVAYFFGNQPVIFSLAGVVFDSLYTDWFTKFFTLYQTTLRGTQLARRFELIELVLPNMKVVGSIISLQHNQNSARDSEIFFSMQFLAKDIVPIPMPNLSSSTLTNIMGQLIDFSVGKQGVGGSGYSLSVGNGTTTSTTTSGTSGALGSIASDFGTTLNSFRTSIFSPIYGIISSITKIIKTSNGSISSIISSFTNPVNAILRDVMNISTQAVAIANLVETSVNNLIAIPDRIVINTRNTLQSLQNAAGVISRVPESLSDILKRQFRTGRVKQGAAILSSGKNNTKSKAAVLSSGAPYSPVTAYSL